MACCSNSAALRATISEVIPPKGWGIPSGLKPFRPKVRAWVWAEFRNGTVQITTVGIPLFSKAMASCIQHAVQDPQSAMAVTTKSHLEASSSMMSSAAGLE